MNAVQLKKRAEKLANKLNALGFSKGGKPMVVDQAFELVAALEGFRNQHALRASLGANPAEFVAIPVDLDEEFAKAVLVQHTLDEDDHRHAHEAWEFIVAEAKKRGLLLVAPETDSASNTSQAHADWASICHAQGWNEESQLIHAMGFIADRGLMLDFVAYAQKAADEENSMVDAGNSETEGSLDPSFFEEDFLKELGYFVGTSDYRKPYWEIGEREASVDYDNESEAWKGAWAHATRTTYRMAGLTKKVFLADLSKAKQLELMRKYSYLVLEARRAALEHNGYVFNEDADQGVLYTWRFHNEGCDSSLDSMEAAVQSAWSHMMAITRIPAEVMDATPLEAQRFVIEGALGGLRDVALSAPGYGITVHKDKAGAAVTTVNIPSGPQKLVAPVKSGTATGDSMSEMAQAVLQLESRWGTEHGYYTRQDWQNDVSKGDTKLGYWEWVQHNIESRESQSDDHIHCRECGCQCGLDGEGEDGLCGNCADRAFTQQEKANREKAHRDCAEETFMAYDFGGGLTVTDFDGWEYTSQHDHWKRAVYLQAEDYIQGDSIKKTFEVWVAGGKVTEVKVS